MMPRHRAAEPSGNRARGTSTHRNDRRFRVPVLTGALSISAAWFARLPQALAIGLGLVPADPEYAGRLRSAQIAAIVRLTPLTMGASCLNAAILLMTLGRMGSLRPGLWIWSALVFALAAYYGRNWQAGRHRDPNRQATTRTMRRTVIHGALFGGLWGVVPMMTFP